MQTSHPASRHVYNDGRLVSLLPGRRASPARLAVSVLVRCTGVEVAPSYFHLHGKKNCSPFFDYGYDTIRFDFIQL